MGLMVESRSETVARREGQLYSLDGIMVIKQKFHRFTDIRVTEAESLASVLGKEMTELLMQQIEMRKEM